MIQNINTLKTFTAKNLPISDVIIVRLANLSDDMSLEILIENQETLHQFLHYDFPINYFW